MKPKSHILIALSYLFLNATHGQENTNGIYVTAQDFASNNLKHASTDTRFKLHDFFKKDIVEVKCKECTYTYSKKDIFGYVDKAGKSYRFFDGKTYSIINPQESILIYKISNGPAQKGQQPSYVYYFSKDAKSELIPFTIENILLAFSDNKPFQNILEIHFNNKSDLLEYDNLHKQYKLNRLLEISKNETY